MKDYGNQRAPAMDQGRAAADRTPEQRKALSSPFPSDSRVVAQRRAMEQLGMSAPVQRVAEEEEDPVQAKREPVQLMEDEEEEPPLQRRCAGSAAQLQADAENQRMAQAKADESNGGLPAQLRAGIEALSGMDMSGVRVHRNSSQPAELNALAYAQGNDIHLGPGQEKHLPHEAWHVVQQLQGRVEPMIRSKSGSLINNDTNLENDADIMGRAALMIPHSVSNNLYTGPFVQKKEATTGIKTPKYLTFNKLRNKLINQKILIQCVIPSKDEKNINKTLNSLMNTSKFEEVDRLCRSLLASEINWFDVVNKSHQNAITLWKRFEMLKESTNPITQVFRNLVNNFLEFIDGRSNSSFVNASLIDKIINCLKSDDPLVIKYKANNGNKEKVNHLIREKNREEKELDIRMATEEICNAMKARLRTAAYFLAEVPNDHGDESLLKSIDALKTHMTSLATKYNLHEIVSNLLELNNSYSKDIEDLQNLAKEVQLILIKIGKGSAKDFEETISEPKKQAIEEKRADINSRLSEISNKIANTIPGAKLKYRGSLSDGMRSFRKSTPINGIYVNIESQAVIEFGKKISIFDENNFDVDAYVEIPNEIWDAWREIPDAFPSDSRMKEKILLKDWNFFIGKIENPTDEVLEVKKYVSLLLSFEVEARQCLQDLSGYKITDGVPDFEMPAQSASKTAKQHALGKPFPLFELSQSGLAYRELMADVRPLSEEGAKETVVHIAEKHITIDAGVT